MILQSQHLSVLLLRQHSATKQDNKVSLFARVIDLDSGETGDMIFNKYDAVNSDLDDPEEPELLPEELELLAKLDAEAE